MFYLTQYIQILSFQQVINIKIVHEIILFCTKRWNSMYISQIQYISILINHI